jgi:hypothetical protein
LHRIQGAERSGPDVGRTRPVGLCHRREQARHGIWRQLPVDHHRARPQLDHLPAARRVLTPALPRGGCHRHGVFYCGQRFKERRTTALRCPVRPAGRG